MRFPDVNDIQQLYNASVATNDDAGLRIAVMEAIYTALAVPAKTTAAITISPASEENFIKCLDELAQKGFHYTLSTSTFTVGW